MTLRKIARLGHPVLLERAREVADHDEPEIRRLIDDMIETLRDAGGFGIAAPQVHAALRIILVVHLEEGNRPRGDDPLVLLNPILEPVGSERELAIEGCLSIPGIRGIIPRYRVVRYDGIDRDGKPLSGEASGLFARILQHEVDHLDGILFPERLVHPCDMAFESERKHLEDRMRSANHHVE
ncbi:MAG: peptide deformylase [Geminicoccaceae bacterium]